MIAAFFFEPCSEIIEASPMRRARVRNLASRPIFCLSPLVPVSWHFLSGALADKHCAGAARPLSDRRPKLARLSGSVPSF